MPRDNLKKTKINTTRKPKKRSPKKIKKHIGKTVKTKKVRKIRKNTSNVTKNHKGKLMSWNRYQKLHTIYSFLHYLELEYPAICTVRTIGKSVRGVDIKMLTISNTDETNSPVWLDGTIHSREWISTSVVTFIANLIAKNFEQLPSYITNKDWYIVPVVNPDGYRYTQHVRMWRKNLAKCNKQVVGVDLNRNFSYMWGTNEDEGSSSMDPHHSQYRGPKPFSEPESAAVRNFIANSEKRFEIFLTFHSPDQAITIPWCYTAEPCPDYVKLMQGGAVMANAIYQATGRIYKVGTFRDAIYCAAGTSLDWSYGSAKIPFSYLIELRKGGKRFILPETQILDTCKEATVAVESLMQFVDKSQVLSKSNEANVEASSEPCFSKQVNENSNCTLTESINSQNDDPLVQYCRKMPRMCEYNNLLLTKTVVSNVQWQKEWRVNFADNCYTRAILNSKNLSAKVRKLPVIKEKRSVNTVSSKKKVNWPGVNN